MRLVATFSAEDEDPEVLVLRIWRYVVEQPVAISVFEAVRRIRARSKITRHLLRAPHPRWLRCKPS